MRRALSFIGGVMLAVAVTGINWRVEAGQAKSQAELRKPFVGSWRLVSIEGGTNPETRGSKPTGIIMYDVHGNMAVQIQPDRQRPTYTGTPTPEQALARMRGTRRTSAPTPSTRRPVP